MPMDFLSQFGQQLAELTGMIQSARLVVGVAVVAYLVWTTIDRFLGDNTDPSAFFGGDWLLIRASGPAFIGVGVVVAMWALAPWMSLSLAGLLVGLFVVWYVLKTELEGTQ